MAVSSPFAVIQQLLQNIVPSSSSTTTPIPSSTTDSYTKITSVFKSTFLGLNIANYRNSTPNTTLNKSLTLQDGIKVLQALLKIPSNDHIEIALQYLVLILPFLTVPFALPSLSMEKLYSQTITSLCTTNGTVSITSVVNIPYQRQITILLCIGILADLMTITAGNSSSSSSSSTATITTVVSPLCCIPVTSISLIESLILPMKDPSVWINSLLNRIPLPNNGYTMEAGKLLWTGLIYGYRSILGLYTTVSSMTNYSTIMQQRIVPWYTILCKIGENQYKKSLETTATTILPTTTPGIGGGGLTVLQEKNHGTETNTPVFSAPSNTAASSSSSSGAFITFLITQQTNFYTCIWKYCLDTEQLYVNQQNYNSRLYPSLQDFLQHILGLRTIAIEWFACTATSSTNLTVYNLPIVTNKDSTKTVPVASTVKAPNPSKISSSSDTINPNSYEIILDKILGQSRWSVNKYLQALGKYGNSNNNTNGNIDHEPLVPLVSSTHQNSTHNNKDAHTLTNAPSKYNNPQQKEQREENQKYKQNLEKHYTQEHLRPASDTYRRIHSLVKKYFPFPSVLDETTGNGTTTGTTGDSKDTVSSTNINQGDNVIVPATPAPKTARSSKDTLASIPPPSTVSKSVSTASNTSSSSSSSPTNSSDGWPVQRIFTPYVAFLRSYGEICRLSNEFTTAVTIIRSLGMYAQRVANYVDTLIPASATVPKNNDSSLTLVKLVARFLSAECSALAALDTLRSLDSTVDTLEGNLGGIRLSGVSNDVNINDTTYVTGKTNAASLLRTSVAAVQKYGILLIQYVNQQSQTVVSSSNASGVTRRLALDSNSNDNENSTGNHNETVTTSNENLENATLSLSRITDTWLQICEWWQSHANLGLGVQTTSGSVLNAKVGSTSSVKGNDTVPVNAPGPVKKRVGVRFNAVQEDETISENSEASSTSSMDTSFTRLASSMATPAKRTIGRKVTENINDVDNNEEEENNFRNQGSVSAPIPAMTPFHHPNDISITTDNDKDISSSLMTVKKPSNNVSSVSVSTVVPPPAPLTAMKPPSGTTTSGSNNGTGSSSSGLSSGNGNTIDWWLLLEQAALVLTKITNETLTTVPLSSVSSSSTITVTSASSSAPSFSLPTQTPFMKGLTTATPVTNAVPRSMLRTDSNIAGNNTSIPLRYCLSAAAKCSIIAGRSRLVRLHLAAAGINLTNNNGGKGILTVSVRKSWYLLLSAGLLPSNTLLSNYLVGSSSDNLSILCDSPGSLLLLNTDAVHHIKKVIQYVTDGQQLAIQVGSNTGLTLLNDMNTILMNTAVPMINAALQTLNNASVSTGTIVSSIPSVLLPGTSTSSSFPNPLQSLQPVLSDTDREQCAEISILLLTTICQGWEQWMTNYDSRRQQLMANNHSNHPQTSVASKSRLFTETVPPIEKGRNDAIYADALNISQLSLRYSLLNACYTVILRKNTLNKSVTDSTNNLIHNIQRAIYWHVRDTLSDIQAQLCMDSLHTLIQSSSSSSSADTETKIPPPPTNGIPNNLSKDTIFDNLMPLLSNAIFGNANDASIDNMYSKATLGILDLVTYVSKGAINLIRKTILPLMNVGNHTVSRNTDGTKEMNTPVIMNEGSSSSSSYISFIDPTELGTLIASALLNSVNDVVLTNTTNTSIHTINENVISSTLVPLAVSISILRSTGYVAVRKTAQLLKQFSHQQRSSSTVPHRSVASTDAVVRYQTERWISLFFGLFTGLASCGDRNMSCGALITLEVASAVHALTYVIQTGQRMFYHYQYKPSVIRTSTATNTAATLESITVVESGGNTMENANDDTNDTNSDDDDDNDDDDDTDNERNADNDTIHPTVPNEETTEDKAWCIYCASYQLLRPVLQAMYAHASTSATATLFPLVLMQQLYTQAIDSALCTNTSITNTPSSLSINNPSSSSTLSSLSTVHYGCNCETGIQTITNDVVLHWLTKVTVPGSLTSSSLTTTVPSSSSSSSSSTPRVNVSLRNRIFLHTLQDRYQSVLGSSVGTTKDETTDGGLRKYYKEYSTLINLSNFLRIVHDGVKDSLTSLLPYQIVWAHRMHTELLPIIDKLLILGLSVSNVRSFKYTASPLAPTVTELLQTLMDIEGSISRQEQPVPKSLHGSTVVSSSQLSSLPHFTNSSLIEMSRKYFGTLISGLCHTVTGWIFMVTGPGVRSMECALSHFTCAINMWSKCQMNRLKENISQRYSTSVGANSVNFFLLEDGRIESLGLVECLTITGRLWLNCYNDSRRSIYCLQRALVICQAEGIDFLYTNTTDQTISFASHIREWLSLAYSWQGNLDQAYKCLFLVTTPSLPTVEISTNTGISVPSSSEPYFTDYFLPSRIRNRFDSYKISTWNQILAIHYRKASIDGCTNCTDPMDKQCINQFQSTFTLLYQYMDQERCKLLSPVYQHDSIDEHIEYSLLRTYRILQSSSKKETNTQISSDHSLITKLLTKRTKHCGILYEQSVQSKSFSLKTSMQQGIESFFNLTQLPWEYLPSLFVDTCRWLALYSSLNGKTPSNTTTAGNDYMDIWNTYLPNTSKEEGIFLSNEKKLSYSIGSLIGPTLLGISINPEFSLRILRIFRERLLIQNTVSSSINRSAVSVTVLPSSAYDQYTNQLSVSLDLLKATVQQDLSIPNLVNHYRLRHDWSLTILYPWLSLNPWNTVCLGIESTTNTGLLGRIPSVYSSNGKSVPYVCTLTDINPSLNTIIHEFRTILTDSFLSVTNIPGGSTSTAAMQENQFTNGGGSSTNGSLFEPDTETTDDGSNGNISNTMNETVGITKSKGSKTTTAKKTTVPSTTVVGTKTGSNNGSKVPLPSSTVPPLSENDKQNWWNSRFKIDKRLATVCEQLETKILTTIGSQGLVGTLPVTSSSSSHSTSTLTNTPPFVSSSLSLPVPTTETITATNSTTTGTVVPLDIGKLDSLKLTELRGLAAERNIKLTTSMKKPDIIQIILQYEEKQRSSSNGNHPVGLTMNSTIARTNNASIVNGDTYYTHSSTENVQKDIHIFTTGKSGTMTTTPTLSSTTLTSLLSFGNLFNGSFSTTASSSLVLVLSSEIQELPWESIPILRNSSNPLSISRLPYTGFLNSYTLTIQSVSLLSSSRTTSLPSLPSRASYVTLLEKLSPIQASIVRTGLSILQIPEYKDSDYLTYIINPSGDLVRTQTTLEPVLHDMAIKTNSMSTTITSSAITQVPNYGLAGTKPLITDILQYLRVSSFYVYCGHGTGESFCSRDTISKSLYGIPVSLLMGCSSGKLVPLTRSTVSPSLASSQTPSVYHHYVSPVHSNDSIDGGILSYLIGGSPSVVGCLWDVTDKDIDRYTIGLLSVWSSSSSTPSVLLGKGLSRAVNENRNICILPYLVGSAPVCYGVPL